MLALARNPSSMISSIPSKGISKLYSGIPNTELLMHWYELKKYQNRNLPDADTTFQETIIKLTTRNNAENWK